MSSPDNDRLIYFIATGLTVHLRPSAYGDGRVMRRGDILRITPAVLEANTDRNGKTFLSLDADGQVARFGRQMWVEGDLPTDFDPLEAGTPEAEAAYEMERARLWREVADDDERRRLLAQLRERFDIGCTSRTLMTYSR